MQSTSIGFFYTLILSALLLVLPVQPAVSDDGPRNLKILGWVENAYLIEPDFELKAKLDTGALTSSLDARIIKKFRQYGKRWVRFAVRNPDTGEETVLVRERERTIGIVQHEGDNEIRPTVKMAVCIAGIEQLIEVSLVNRSRFKYPLLLGRRTLENIAIIHPGETFMAESKCKAPPSHSDEIEPRPQGVAAEEEIDDAGEGDCIEQLSAEDDSA
ncbi:MAG: ATP-dependent zinc protease [Xanthomonadales bacterium]|nr:ATP-dependent zinc protease [Xanthomonadales bacterium]NNL95999.1 ATP-dependent zinc protease [Xanthomonadales bacterium]